MIEPLLSDDALIADFAAARGKGDAALHVWWLAQSGFLVEAGETRVLFDPYLSDSLTRKYATTNKPHVRMTRRVISPERLAGLDVVFSTHAHTDHLDAETLNATFGASPEATLVYPIANDAVVSERVTAATKARIGMKGNDAVELDGVSIRAIPSAHDQIETDVQGRHKYLGYVVSVGGFTVYHSGDTVVYDGLAELLRPHEIDIAFLPINGQVGNMGGTDAAQLAHDAGIKLVIPCHYEMFEFNTASPSDQFIPACHKLGQGYRVMRAGERVTIAPGGRVVSGGVTA